MANKKCFAYLYAAAFPFVAEDKMISFAPRAEEISACSNEFLRKQKFYVWKLLEFATVDALGLKLDLLNLKRDKNGKWHSDKCCFSLTHSKNVVAVALSDNPIGVDAERVDSQRFDAALENRIATQAEKTMFGDRFAHAERVCALWTRKESMFKREGEKVFRPCVADACFSGCRSFFLKGLNDEFILSAAGGSMSQAILFSPFENVVWSEEIK